MDAKEVADGLVPIYSLLSMIRIELERGRDVIVTVTPTSDGKPGALKLPDGWEEFMFQKTNRSDH